MSLKYPETAFSLFPNLIYKRYFEVLVLGKTISGNHALKIPLLSEFNEPYEIEFLVTSWHNKYVYSVLMI